VSFEGSTNDLTFPTSAFTRILKCSSSSVLPLHVLRSDSNVPTCGNSHRLSKWYEMGRLLGADQISPFPGPGVDTNAKSKPRPGRMILLFLQHVVYGGIYSSKVGAGVIARRSTWPNRSKSSSVSVYTDAGGRSHPGEREGDVRKQL
jgi:hypothetical protein